MQPHECSEDETGVVEPWETPAEQPQDVSLVHLGGCRAWPCSCQQLRGPERQLCSLPAPRSSPEQHSATTNNFQEQFTNGGETKIKKSESCLWSNFVRFAPRVEHGVTIQRQMTLKTAEIRLSQCTSNIIWWCTHTAPRATLQGFLYTHNSYQGHPTGLTPPAFKESGNHHLPHILEKTLKTRYD